MIESERLFRRALRGIKLHDLERLRRSLDDGACATGGLLTYAVCDGTPETIRILLDRGAGPDDSLGRAGTPLTLAAELGRLAHLEILLASGPSRENVERSFACAVYHRHFECADRLLESGIGIGVDCLVSDDPGWTLLQNCCCWKRAEQVVYLLSRGADRTRVASTGLTVEQLAEQPLEEYERTGTYEADLAATIRALQEHRSDT